MAKIYIGLIELSSPTKEEAQKKSETRARNSEISNKLIAHFFELCGAGGARIIRNQFKKPRAQFKKDMFFNLSHSGNFFLIALSFELDIGVDIELVKRRKNLKEIYEIYYNEDEIVELEKSTDEIVRLNLFYKLWVQKEAIVKLEGKTVFEIGKSRSSSTEKLEGMIKKGRDTYFFHIAIASNNQFLGTKPIYEFKAIKAANSVIHFSD